MDIQKLIDKINNRYAELAEKALKSDDLSVQSHCFAIMNELHDILRDLRRIKQDADKNVFPYSRAAK